MATIHRLVRSRLPLRSPLFVSASRSKYTMANTDGYGGVGMTRTPKDSNSSFIFLHGLGDTCDGWSILSEQYEPCSFHSTMRFIFPTASSIPVAINGNVKMPAWSNVYGLTAESREDPEGFQNGFTRLTKIIDGEIARGVKPGRIFIGGFSQGGAVALHTAMRREGEALGGVISLSSWLPFKAEYPAAMKAAGKATPVWMGHGKDDGVVSFQWGEATAEVLREMGCRVEFMAIERMGHSANPDELTAVAKFVERSLAETSP
eukprot:GDKH01020069.1.p1 GENE.GDKH01020069.1~~GDKH01020069.1.p1  ORF type:complete len:261 (-),score=38.81 GDKH01020069.1:113-895(-)